MLVKKFPLILQKMCTVDRMSKLLTPLQIYSFVQNSVIITGHYPPSGWVSITLNRSSAIGLQVHIPTHMCCTEVQHSNVAKTVAMNTDYTPVLCRIMLGDPSCPYIIGSCIPNIYSLCHSDYQVITLHEFTSAQLIENLGVVNDNMYCMSILGTM